MPPGAVRQLSAAFVPRVMGSARVQKLRNGTK